MQPLHRPLHAIAAVWRSAGAGWCGGLFVWPPLMVVVKGRDWAVWWDHLSGTVNSRRQKDLVTSVFRWPWEPQDPDCESELGLGEGFRLHRMLGWGCSSVIRAADWRAADAGSIPRSGLGFFLPESTFSADSLTVSVHSRVQSHALSSARTLIKIL